MKNQEPIKSGEISPAKREGKNGCNTLGEYFLFLLHAFYIFPFSQTPLQLKQEQTSNWYASLQIEPFISYICSSKFAHLVHVMKIFCVKIPTFLCISVSFTSTSNFLVNFLMWCEGLYRMVSKSSFSGPTLIMELPT